jgi:hypothetical protein
VASDTTQLQVQEPEPEPEPEPEAPGEQGDTSDETPAAPLSAAAAAVAAAAALAAKHVEGSDVELAKVWVEIAGGAGTLTASELRTVFQKLGREMSDDVSSRSTQPPNQCCSFCAAKEGPIRQSSFLGSIHMQLNSNRTARLVSCPSYPGLSSAVTHAPTRMYCAFAINR